MKRRCITNHTKNLETHLVNELTLQGTYNARSIGDPRAPWLVRTAAVDALTAADELQLRDLGVTQIIDLRETSEHATRSHSLPVVSVPLYGAAPPSDGTLEAVYLGLLHNSGRALALAVTQLAVAEGASLVHCAAGKDRTGLVVALARLAAGDDRATVIADYELSGDRVRPQRIDLVTRQLNGLGIAGADRAAAERLHLDSPAAALGLALDELDALGGATEYLLAHGTPQEALSALQSRALAGAVR